MLEGMLQQVRPEVANDHFSHLELPSQADAQENPAPNFEASNASITLASSHEREDVNELSSKVGLLALNAPGTEPKYFGSSSAFAFSRMINSSLQRLRAQDGNGKSKGQDRLDDQHSQTVFPCQLPSPAIGEMLTKAYFEHVHTQYPFLHEATFKSWEHSIMNGVEDSGINHVMCFFVNMVYAVGALVLPHNMHGCTSEGFYASAQLYMDYVIQLDSIESIQALLCCTMYSLRSPVGVSVWSVESTRFGVTTKWKHRSLSGLALRQCIELGYHRSAKKFVTAIDPLRTEMRKRVFWCAYGIDRAASMTLGRPFGIPDQEIDIEYPLDIDEAFVTAAGVLSEPRTSVSEPPTSMSAAIHTFQLRRIWSQIHNSLYSSLDHDDSNSSSRLAQIEYLRNELTQWRDTTPPQTPTHTTLSVFDSRAWFNLAYNHSVLLLYRGQLTADTSASEPNSVEVFMHCSRAAQEICFEYRRLYIGKPMSYTWGALHILFLAGLTYLHCLWTSHQIRETTRQDEISSTCTACTMVLVVLAERWEQAAPYRDIFEALAAKTMSMIVDKHQERWRIPDDSAPIVGQYGAPLHIDMAQWFTNIADVGVSDGIESLLTGLYDFGNDPMLGTEPDG
ncbi:hypothetical protein BP5796_08812 [Coleophoma crateriformis]|uniref:Xylanolytic transcriptional activator regulatory domain-containing protein n=1 Tax=Coleophoma crateriformis TaxID=565419 RepID=A0A3D8R8N9_9HELO|nr:hypothetical protein BP5796_08812 [Coleophoma crateriformis]